MALGAQQDGEGLSDYVRRASYELDRLDAIAEQHRRWHTHTDERTAECFICAYQHLARCYIGVLRDYGGIAESVEESHGHGGVGGAPIEQEDETVK